LRSLDGRRDTGVIDLGGELAVLLIGHPEVRIGGRPVSLPTRKTLPHVSWRSDSTCCCSELSWMRPFPQAANRRGRLAGPLHDQGHSTAKVYSDRTTSAS
jgi:hypothetical protein